MYPTIYVLSNNKQNITFFHLKIIIFTAVKYYSILYGRVFVIIGCHSVIPNKLITTLKLTLITSNRENCNRNTALEWSVINGPRSEKTGLRGFRPGPTQTGLYSHKRWLEA